MLGMILYVPSVMAKSMTKPGATPCCKSCAANKTSNAMGTGITTAITLTIVNLRRVGSASNSCQGISASMAAAITLVNSMMVRVGLNSIHTFFAKSQPISLDTVQNDSVQFVS